MPPAGTATPFTFTVLTSSDTCTWNFEGVATPNGPSPLPPPWMSYPQPLSGTGSGTVSIGFVTPNTGTAPRDVTFIYGGQTITLTQPVNLCQFTFSGPSPARIPANGGTGSFTVNTAGSGCSYYAFPGDGVTITSGATGSTFPATVGFSVAPNTSDGPLTRAVTVSPTPTPVIVSRRQHPAERSSSGDRCPQAGFPVCGTSARYRPGVRLVTRADTGHELGKSHSDLDRIGLGTMAGRHACYWNEPVDGCDLAESVSCGWLGAGHLCRNHQRQLSRGAEQSAHGAPVAERDR